MTLSSSELLSRLRNSASGGPMFCYLSKVKYSVIYTLIVFVFLYALNSFNFSQVILLICFTKFCLRETQ